VFSRTWSTCHWSARSEPAGRPRCRAAGFGSTGAAGGVEIHRAVEPGHTAGCIPGNAEADQAVQTEVQDLFQPASGFARLVVTRSDSNLPGRYKGPSHPAGHAKRASLADRAPGAARRSPSWRLASSAQPEDSPAAVRHPHSGSPAAAVPTSAGRPPARARIAGMRGSGAGEPAGRGSAERCDGQSCVARPCRRPESTIAARAPRSSRPHSVIKLAGLGDDAASSPCSTGRRARSRTAINEYMSEGISHLGGGHGARAIASCVATQ
jgi:hypothetical protein